VAVVRDNPYSNVNFIVEVDGVAAAGFSEVDLPEGRIDVIEYREGSDKTSDARKLPGRVGYSNVVLRRGVTGRTDLYDWWNLIREGALDRRAVAIVLLDEARNPVQRWHLVHAWPTRLAYSQLNALGDENVIETLELAYERFTME
jgi:phage tail-like protein